MISLRKASRFALASALVFTAACSDDALPTAPRPAKLIVWTPSTSTATTTAYTPLADPIRVRLVASNEEIPIANAVVRFSVAGSGTTATGAYVSVDSAITDDAGFVEFEVFAGTPGTYTVTITSEGVTPVTVNVTSTAPGQDAIVIFGGNAQGGFAGEPIAPFTALVLNELGRPQPGVTVTFQVTSGGGSVSPITAVTDANGRASTTLTLGSGAVQTVRATAAGLSAEGSTNTSTTFTATVADPCTAARTMAVPATLNRALDALDCRNAQSRRLEYHAFTTTGALSSVVVTQTSTAFAPSLTLSRVGGADTLAKDTLLAPGTVSYRIFAPAGTWWLRASSQGADQTGAFTLTTAAGNTTNDNCPSQRIFVVPGTADNKTSIAGNIATTDCVFSGDPTVNADQYYVYLRQGEVLRIELQSVPLSDDAIDMWIRVQNLTTGAFNNTDCCAGGTVESRTHTAATSGLYRFEAGVYATSSTPSVGNYVMDFWKP